MDAKPDGVGLWLAMETAKVWGMFAHEYAQAKERENYTVQQWAEYEQQQLHRLFVHAFTNVPYYHESFSNAGINVDQLKK